MRPRLRRNSAAAWLASAPGFAEFSRWMARKRAGVRGIQPLDGSQARRGARNSAAGWLASAPGCAELSRCMALTRAEKSRRCDAPRT